jgi:AraC-like DNA-binding protein
MILSEPDLLMTWAATHLTPVCFGREYRGGSTELPRHRHEHAYLSLVLKGSVEEAGDRGRYRVRAGQVLVHAPFEGHRNLYPGQGAEVINLALDWRTEPDTAVMVAADPDRVVRLAERDPREAAAFLFGTSTPLPGTAGDWQEELARAIALDPGVQLHVWAEEHHLADATVSRGFRQVFGISPSGYRAQVRARLAFRQISSGECSLSAIAAHCGFCDQAHMSHAIQAMTGRTPSAWRRIVK